MNKTINFKGRILFVSASSKRKTIPLKYAQPSLREDFAEDISETMMVNFDYLKLSSFEKKNLSRSHRKMLNCYRHLSPFSLSADANKLIHVINQSEENSIIIEATQYGAYVCLAALYSGKLNSSKKIEFILEQSPLALFPKNFMKSKSPLQNHKVTYRLSEECWLSPFESLYSNEQIKISVKNAA